MAFEFLARLQDDPKEEVRRRDLLRKEGALSPKFPEKDPGEELFRMGGLLPGHERRAELEGSRKRAMDKEFKTRQKILTHELWGDHLSALGITGSTPSREMIEKLGPYLSQVKTSGTDSQRIHEFRKELGNLVDAVDELGSLGEEGQKSGDKKVSQPSREFLERRLKETEEGIREGKRRGQPVEHLLREYDEINRFLSEDAAKGTMPVPTNELPKSDSIKDAFEGARVPRQAVVDAGKELFEKYKLAGDGENIGFGAKQVGTRVNFGVGVKQLLQDEFPDLVKEFMAEWGSIYAERQKLGAQAGKDQDMPPESKYKRLEDLYRQLGDAEELQNWTAVVAYVLLSFLIGPRSAMLFFSNAREKRTLQGQIEGLELEIKESMQRDKEDRDRQFEARKFATTLLERRQEKADDREVRLWELVSREERMARRAEAKAETDADRELIEGLHKNWQTAMAMAGRQLQILQDPLMPADAKKKAQELYNDYFGQAARLAERLRIPAGEE